LTHDQREDGGEKEEGGMRKEEGGGMREDEDGRRKIHTSPEGYAGLKGDGER